MAEVSVELPEVDLEAEEVDLEAEVAAAQEVAVVATIKVLQNE